MPGETKEVGVKVGGDAGGFNNAIMGAQRKLGTFKKAALGVTAAVGVAAGAMAGKSVSAAADFQGAMTESLAIMGDVSDSMRKDMAEAAREVGNTTQFSATQAAESYYYLASAGLDAAESEEALGDMAKFAQAGQFDMARATDIATDANSALGREIENVDGVMNSLVKSNELANASVEQFGQALTRKAGNAMNRFNMDLSEGMAILAQFADTGLKGNKAGTIFNRTLKGLSTQARENQSAFEELGVQVYNGEGEMRNMADIVSDLEDGLKGMSTAEKEAALAKLGFNERASDGIMRLMGNSEALREYQKELENAEGAVDRVASKQLENFNSQMGLLQDNINDVFIGLGNKMLPSLTDLVKNGLRPTVMTLSDIVEESDGFIDFLDRASEQWLPGMNSEFKRLWSEGGGDFMGMLRQVGQEQPAFQGALNAIAGGMEAVVNWFNQVDWQYQKQQALNMAGDVGEEFKGLGQIVSDTLGDITGFEPEGSIDFDWDISTGLGEALKSEFGIEEGGEGEASTEAAAAGIRSAVFAFITAGTNNVYLGALAATVGVNLAAKPTVKFASDLITAVKSKKQYKDLDEKGVDFGNLPIDMEPIVKFGRNVRDAVWAEDSLASLSSDGEIDFGKLDIAIEPVADFAMTVREAVLAEDSLKALSSDGEVDFPKPLEIVIEPVADFGIALREAVLAEDTLQELSSDGSVDFPGKLDVIIEPLADLGDGIRAAVKATQSWNHVAENGVDMGAVDFWLKPTVKFSKDLEKRIDKSGPVQGVLETGVEYPIPVSLGISGITWGVAKTGGKIASLGKSLASIVAGFFSITGAVALGTIAASIGISKLNKELGKEGKYEDFFAWLQSIANNEIPESWEKEINVSWQFISELGASKIFADFADAWEKWKKDPPWKNYNWDAPEWNWPEIVPDWAKNWKDDPPAWASTLANWFSQADLEREFSIVLKGWDALKSAWNWWNNNTGKPAWNAFMSMFNKGGVKGQALGARAGNIVDFGQRGGGGLLGLGGGKKQLITESEIGKLQTLFQDQNATTEEKVGAINSLLDEAAQLVEEGKAEKSELSRSIMDLASAISGFEADMWQPPDDWTSNQSGTPWTGSGPRNQVAGFVHRQEAVIPSNVLRGGPGPILDFLGYSPGGGSLEAGSGQAAAKLDKIEQNTAKVADKLNAVAGGEGGQINVEIQGVTDLDSVLAAITEEWQSQRRAVGR